MQRGRIVTNEVITGAPGHLAHAASESVRRRMARFVRELEAQKLSSSTINNYMLPLTGTLAMSVSRGLLAQTPCLLLTKDERPAKKVTRTQDHVWNDTEIDALLDTAQHLARQPASRYNYTPILRLVVYTGLRLGELLGLEWQDVELDAQELQVRQQWRRAGEFAPPKTAAARRRVPLQTRQFDATFLNRQPGANRAEVNDVVHRQLAKFCSLGHQRSEKIEFVV